jgi:hypothetical protein
MTPRSAKPFWIAGWNEPGYLPLATPEVFEEWRDAFSYLREHFLCHAWECGEMDVEANLSSLAFCEGYCEGAPFEYFARATHLNYFIHSGEQDVH